MFEWLSPSHHFVCLCVSVSVFLLSSLKSFILHMSVLFTFSPETVISSFRFCSSIIWTVCNLVSFFETLKQFVLSGGVHKWTQRDQNLKKKNIVNIWFFKQWNQKLDRHLYFGQLHSKWSWIWWESPINGPPNNWFQMKHINPINYMLIFASIVT